MVSLFRVGGVLLTCCNVLAFLTLLAFPITADAFSRRADSAEVGLHQAQAHQGQLHQAQAHQGQAAGDGKSDANTPHAVPEPPALWLLGIGVSLFAIFSLIKQFRGRAGSHDHAM